MYKLIVLWALFIHCIGTHAIEVSLCFDHEMTGVLVCFERYDDYIWVTAQSNPEETVIEVIRGPKFNKMETIGKLSMNVYRDKPIDFIMWWF